MLATLTTSGSGAVSTQTECGRRRRTIRSETIRCSRRFLSLRSSCSPRWSSTAGSELRLIEPASATVETPAPERRTRSSGLAPMKAASGVPTQKQKQEGNCSRIAPKAAAGSWAAGRLDDDLAGDDDLAHLPRLDPLGRGGDGRFELARGADAADARAGGRVGVDHRQRLFAQSRQARRELAASRPGSSPGPAIALTVR